MMPMKMMPNRSLFNIQSSKITSRDWARTAEPHTARPVAVKSPLLRAPDQLILRRDVAMDTSLVQRSMWAL